MRIALLALAVVLATARIAGAETIGGIIVEGNTKTTTDTVELIAKISVGDDWDPSMRDRIKADLVSSGLFKEVEVFWDAMPKGGGVRVHLTVKDKFSWVIAPAFYNQPTNKGFGVGYGENNLLGTNQKLVFYGQLATGDSFLLGAWVIPAIGGTRFYAQPDIFLNDSHNIEYAPPSGYLDNPKAVRESRIIYLNAGLKLGVELFRGIKIDGRLRGAHVAYRDVRLADGATIADVPGATDTFIPAPGMEGWDVSAQGELSIDRRANWYGIQSGYRFVLSYEQALPALGSDFHYKEASLQLYRAWQVLARHNLVFKGNLDIGHYMPFQQEFLAAGRGYLNNEFRGDFLATGTLEYSVPLFTAFGLSVRGLGFYDSVYDTFLTTSNPERNYLANARHDEQPVYAPFKNSIGVGTRLYLRQIVLPLLGLDFGYGLEARDFQVYLAIGLTD